METSTEQSATPHQPGKSWIVLEEDDGNSLGLPLLMATGQLLTIFENKVLNGLYLILMVTGQVVF